MLLLFVNNIVIRCQEKQMESKRLQISGNFQLKQFCLKPSKTQQQQKIHASNLLDEAAQLCSNEYMFVSELQFHTTSLCLKYPQQKVVSYPSFLLVHLLV